MNVEGSRHAASVDLDHAVSPSEEVTGDPKDGDGAAAGPAMMLSGARATLIASKAAKRLSRPVSPTEVPLTCTLEPSKFVFHLPLFSLSCACVCCLLHLGLQIARIGQ